MCAILGNLQRYQDLMPLTENRPLSTLLFDCKYRLLDFNLSSIENANIKQVYMIFNEGETSRSLIISVVEKSGTWTVYKTVSLFTCSKTH